jgi:catechol 2,3-dioxygenase-like lactoylglutathione lyase family enzyme
MKTALKEKHMALGENAVCQVAIVVRDIEAAIKKWAGVLGAPPPAWHMTGPKEESHINYRGQSTDARAKLAFFELGQVSLELIEPVGGPSVWQEVLDRSGPCVHHIAFRIKGMDAALAGLSKQGLPTLQRSDFTNGCSGYVDSAKDLGVIVELLEHFK